MSNKKKMFMLLCFLVFFTNIYVVDTKYESLEDGFFKVPPFSLPLQSRRISLY